MLNGLIPEHLLERIDDETVEKLTEMAIAQGFKFDSEKDAAEQVRILLLLCLTWIDEYLAKIDEEYDKQRPQ